MTAAKRLFSLEDIGCRRGGRLLFQNLTLHLQAGEAVHLSGPNGVGKTSFLRIMAGMLSPVAGKIFWEDKTILENIDTEHAARLSFLPADDRALKSLESAFENLRFWAAIWRCPEETVWGALRAMGLEALAGQKVRQMSSGQKRRLSLARLLLRPARLWLLDEPFNALDTQAQDLFMQALERHLAAGGAAVVASHQIPPVPRAGALRSFEMRGAA